MKPVILTMGLNHTTAPINVREQIASGRCIKEDTLTQLHTHLDPDLFSETLILSTCNRTEIYVVTSDQERAQTVLRRLLGGHETLSAPGGDFLYSYSERDAIVHLFDVASGLDSMILGEFEILGQVRHAYLQAAERKSIGPVLHELFKDAIHVGKRAHSETAIGTGTASVAYAAVTLARQQIGELAGKNALVIGAGDMGCRVAKNLSEDGMCMVVVANRTFENAVQLAGQVGGRAIAFDDLAATVQTADLVVSATAAPHIVLTRAMVQGAMQARRDRPICLLDLAVPRDIEPEVALIPNTRLFNIDDLQRLVDEHRAVREQAIVQVRAIIAEEADEFGRWFAERRAAPVISELRERAEVIRAAELQKAMRRLGHLHLNERDRQVIAALSAGIVSKILAAPTVHLKERVSSGDGQVYLETLCELFELDPNEERDIPSAF